jgi:hypothetical protein
MLISTESGKSSTEKFKAWQILPEHINDAWEHIGPQFERALEYARGEIALVDVYKQLVVGFMQAWEVVEDDEPKLVFVTEIINYPQYRAVRIVLAAGRDLKDAKDFQRNFEAWALTNGCLEIECCCRPSMVRFLRKLYPEFAPVYTVLRKNLRGGLQ